MEDKSQSVQGNGASGNGVSPPSTTFGYGQVIPPGSLAAEPPKPTAAPPPQPITPTPPIATPSPPQIQTPPPSSQPSAEAPKPRNPLVIPWKKIGKLVGLILLALLVVAGVIAVVITVLNKQNSTQSLLGSRFNTIQIPLSDLASQDGLALLGTRSLVINGQLRVNNSFIISPSQQPSSASPGQIYYDQNSNQLAYYNGSKFINVTSSDTVVQSVGGLSGSLTLGSGLGSANGQISNTGVLSVQGQTGAVTFTAGPGIAVNGTTISSTGVTSIGGQTGDIQIGTGLSLTSGTLKNSGIVGATGGTGISVVNDGSGNITISNTGAGTGTVQSPGGTTGRIAKFTGVQTIADSLLSESGTTVTVGGDLSVTGNLALGTALSVGNGGTGATSLTANGVLVGQGSGAITAVTAAGSGLCLMSTAGAPAFSACPGGGGGVTSLNGLTGALTVANATAAGSTITINDASTSQKGIAQFNSTNFSASAGVINTIQDINTTAAPTFGRLSLSSSQASNPMLLVNNTNVSGTGNLLDLQVGGSSKFAVSPSGALTLSSTINGQTISSTANFTGTLGVTGLASLSGGATVTGTLTANTITPTGSLTVGATAQSFTLQGNSSSTITATSGVNTSTISFQTPTANVNYRLLTAAAGTYDICTTVGNCAGVGGGVTTAGGTTNKIAKFTGSQAIGDSILTDNGSTVTVGGTLAVNTITPSAAMTIGSTGQNLTLQGATTSLSATSGGITNTLTFATPATSNKTITIPNASGTVAVSATGPLSLDANGNISCANCVTTTGGGGQSAVDSLNGLTGVLTLANATGLGSTVTINDASTAQKGIAQFNSTNFSASSGTINTIQDINTTAAPTFGQLTITSSQATNPMLLVNNTNGAGSGNLLDLQLASSSKFAVSPAGALTLSSTINGQTISSTANFTGTLGVSGLASLSGGATVTGTLTANTITPTGSLTVGSTTQSFTLQGSATSTITSTSGANTTTLAFQSPTANVTYRFLTAAVGTYDICTSIGNCAGTGGGVTTTGGTSGTIAVFTGSNSIGDSLLSQSAGTVTVNGNINLVTGNQFRINGSQISSADLSNDANLAKLSASQTFTGINLFKPSANSVTAFQIQPTASTTPVFNVDTTNSRIGIGNAAPSTDLDIGPSALGASQIVQIRVGDLLLQSQQGAANGISALATRGSNGNLTLDGASGSSLYLSPFTTNNNFLAAGGGNVRVGDTTVPSYKLDVAGSVNVTSGNTYKINGVDICTASGCTAASGSGSYIQNSTTVQTNANIAIQSAADASVSLLIKARATQSADYLRITDSTNALIFDVDNFGGVHATGKITADSAVGVGTAASSGEQLRIVPASTSTIGFTITANTSQTANLIELKNSASEVLTSFGPTGQLALGRVAASGGTQAGSIVFADGTLDNFGLTLNTTTLTASHTISLPNEAGTICLQSSTNCGFAAASGSANYIQNQSASDQTASFRISGTGRANTSLQTPLLDTAAAGTLSLGTTNATAIALNKATTVTGDLNQSSGALSLTANAASSLTTSAGALTITSAASSTWSTTTGTLTLQGTTGNTVALGSGSITLNTSAAGTITVGSSNTTTVNIGALTNNARTVNVGVGTGGTQTQTVNVGSVGGSSVTTIQGGTGSGAIALTPGTNGGINLTTTGTGNINFSTASQFIFQPSTNSTTTFQIKNSSGLNNVFNADTTNARVGINMSNPSETLDVFGNVNIASISVLKYGGSTVLTSGALSFVNAGAGTIQSASSQALNITGHGNSTWSTDSGTLTVQGNSSLTLNTAGGVGATGAVSVQSGNSSLGTAGNTTIDTGTTLTGTPTVNIGTTNAKAVAIGSTGNSTTVTTASSTTAFKIQNASSIAQLTLDTTNARLYVGPTAGDTVGTLTVLGNKTNYTNGANSSDPTGVVGAMYYNSALGQFRCYELDHWRDCLESIRTQYHYSNDMVSVAPDNNISTEGTNGTGGTNFDTLSGETDHPGMLILQTLTSATGFAALVPRTNATKVIRLGNNDYWRFESSQRISTAGGGLSSATQRYTFRAGFIDDATTGDGANGCFFRYSDNVNTGKWQGVCRNASTESTCDSTITVAVDTWYRLTVVVNAAGSSVDFQVNGVSKCQITTNIPTGSTNQTNWGIGMIKSVGTTNRYVDIDYLDALGELGTSR